MYNAVLYEYLRANRNTVRMLFIHLFVLFRFHFFPFFFISFLRNRERDQITGRGVYWARARERFGLRPRDRAHTTTTTTAGSRSPHVIPVGRVASRAGSLESCSDGRALRRRDGVTRTADSYRERAHSAHAARRRRRRRRRRIRRAKSIRCDG